MLDTEEFEKIKGFFSAGTARHKYECYWQAWIADPSFQRNIVIHHGLGEHSGCYESIISAFLGSKINIFSYDACGHGKSKGKHGAALSSEALAEDLRIFLEMLVSEFHIQKPILYGHSLGSLVALKFALKQSNQWHLQGMVLSGAPFRIHLTLLQKMKEFFGLLLHKIWPTLLISSSIPPKMVTHNLEYIKEIKQDKLRMSLYL